MTVDKKLVKIASFLTNKLLDDQQKTHDFIFKTLYEEYYYYDIEEEYQHLMKEEKDFKSYIPTEKEEIIK